MESGPSDPVAVAETSGAFRNLFLRLPVVQFVLDATLALRSAGGSLTEADRRALADETAPLLGRSVLDIVGVGPDSDLEFACRRALAGSPQHTVFCFHARYYDTYLEPLGDSTGSVVGIAGIALNVSGEHATRRALVHSEANLRRATRISGLAWWHYDVGRRLSVSKELRERFGFGTGVESDRERLMDLTHPGDREALAASLSDAECRGVPCRGLDFRLRRPEGSYRWMLQQIEVTKNRAGRVTELDGTLLDITERKLLEEDLRRLAHVDGLTGLANRTLLVERLRETVRDEGDRESTALFFIDVDGFKAINDTYGHDAGDRLLTQVAARIAGCVRPGDFVARSGGDEFVIIVSPAGSYDDVRAIAERIVSACAAPYASEHRELFATVSVGLSIAPNDAFTGEALLRNADSALYAAKLAGRNTFRFFTKAMHAETASRLALENDLRRAVERHELTLAFQPIVSREGKVRSVEALARWQHETHGPIEPSVFIPIAERTGAITKLGASLAAEASRQLSVWRAKAPDLRIALNISAQQLDCDGLVAMLENALAEAGLGFDALEIEVTETVVMRDVERTAAALRSLKDRGARISIDDFGTGYSSLAWLRDLPIDTLKVDRSFVAEIEDVSERSIIVRSIVSLAHAMKLDVVAEGVETERQIAHLASLGCNLFQGYAFSRPVPAERIPDVIDRLASKRRDYAEPSH